jgi:DNA-binding SARP family transcriptional activator
MVAAFSARGTTSDTVRRTAEDDNCKGLTAGREEGVAQDPAAVRPSVEARFFGRFEVSCDGRNVPLSRNSKVVAILKYLLAHRSRSVSRDYLMGWLWPESNLKRARGALNTSVHALRKILDSCPLPAGYSSYVMLEEGHYGLCPAVQVWTDTDEFDSRYDKARSLERAEGMSAAVAEYERAVELYRGDFLVEDLYEEWTMIERQRFANAYVDVLHRLSDYYVGTEQYSKCIRACYKILKKDAYYEAAHRMLMSCHARLGMRTQALQQYRLYESMLKRAFNAEPTAETRALYREIISGKNEATHEQICKHGPID